jgi:hypothetical protein
MGRGPRGRVCSRRPTPSPVGLRRRC